MYIFTVLGPEMKTASAIARPPREVRGVSIGKRGDKGKKVERGKRGRGVSIGKRGEKGKKVERGKRGRGVREVSGVTLNGRGVTGMTGVRTVVYV